MSEGGKEGGRERGREGERKGGGIEMGQLGRQRDRLVGMHAWVSSGQTGELPGRVAGGPKRMKEGWVV